MKWFVPSFNGDVRMVPDPVNTLATRLIIEKPTVAEQVKINAIGRECAKRGWIKEPWEEFAPKTGLFKPDKWEFLLNVGIEELGAMAIPLLRPGPAVLTAIRLEGGKVLTVTGGEVELKEAIAKVDIDPDVDGVNDAVKSDKPKAEAAATVKRHTPCCPDCEEGSVGPAREVLLAFLNEDEHRQWSRTRSIVVIGGMSGCRYRLAHRSSKIAKEQERICYDLDTDTVVHFHDWTVPPEEEVLAAKLILEHREPWLRNEATMLNLHGNRYRKAMVFKNPFGDVHDGSFDSEFMQLLGEGMLAYLSALKKSLS